MIINKFMFVDDVSNFKNLCKERICFYSKNEPYIKLEALSDFAKSIEAKELVYDNAGHFNAALIMIYGRIFNERNNATKI